MTMADPPHLRTKARGRGQRTALDLSPPLSSRSSATSLPSSISSRSTRTSSTGSGSASARSRDRPAAAGAGERHRGIVGAMVVALCVFNVLDVNVGFGDTSETRARGGRRSLLSSLYLAGASTLMPWAEHHLVDVTDRPDPSKETALFWHIPKSGGTTAKRLYQCMGQTLAHRVGADPRYGHDKDTEIVVFEPHAGSGKDWKVVNVDTTIKPGILKAKKMGLVQSHTTDLIFTMEPQFAGSELYDEDHKGRFLAIFRHPVDRALSMFFYLGTATWERTYRPEWANMTVMEWAALDHMETDYVVRKLVGKNYGSTVDEMDLIVAKELVRQRFVVGLMEEMNESIRRFNIVLGVDEESDRSQKCMVEFGVDEREDASPAAAGEEGKGGGVRELGEKKNRATDMKNSNKHPKFEEGSPEYEAVAARNPLDMLLYKHIETLFDAQREIIDSYLLDEDPDLDTNAAERKLALLPPGSEMKAANSDYREWQSHLAEAAGPRAPLETPFFWHVPKSGGTTLQRMYWCMGSAIANEVGVNSKFGIESGVESDLVSFSPWKGNPGKVINVDVSTHEGILKAKNRGFLTERFQPPVDFISTSEFQFASMMLFTPQRKARMFALFRHPIDRAVSKFYYLQKATWEPTYNKVWAKMSFKEWASRDRGDNNWMVRKLIGKGPRDQLNVQDLDLAMELVRAKFVVGLMGKMEESVHRFNLMLGIDPSTPENQECINQFTSSQGDSHAAKNKAKIVKKNEWNSYAHPEVEMGSPAWVSLSKIHMYDNLLYRFIEELFTEQRIMFDEGGVHAGAASNAGPHPDPSPVDDEPVHNSQSAGAE